jgi:hypothetical protein
LISITAFISIKITLSHWANLETKLQSLIIAFRVLVEFSIDQSETLKIILFP